MQFRTMMVIKAVVCLCFGSLILLAPAFVYSLFLGIGLDNGGAFAARQYAASLIGIMLITWFARNVPESSARWAIALGLCIYDAVGFVLALVGEFTGLLGPMGWSIVALYLFLAVGFGYFLFKSPQPAMQARAA
jgi:hypothetical protein